MSSHAACWPRLLGRPRSVATAALLALLLPAPALAMPLGTYTWETATANAVLDDDTIAGDNNDGWMNASGVGRGSGDFVLDADQPDGFFGNYLSADERDDLYLRSNDAGFSYAIPSDATEIVVSIVLTANSSTFTLGGLRSATGNLNFGNTDFGTWGVRDSGGGTIHEAAGSGAALLDGTTRSYRVTLTVDMRPAGATKLADLVVENLSDGGFETIFVGLPFLALDDPSALNALEIRAFGAAVDDIAIAATVPEPTIALLLPLGLLAWTRRRRGVA